MKRLGQIILIFVTSVALMSGCTSVTDNDEKNSKNPLEQYKQYKKYLPILAAILDHSIPEAPPPYAGPRGVIATDGEYLDKVGVNWELVYNAMSYRVYRSENMQGPFTTSELVVSVNAADISPDTGTTDGDTGTTGGGDSTGGTCSDPVMQAVFGSDVDLNYLVRVNSSNGQEFRGVLLQPGTTSSFSITIGESISAICSFEGGFYGRYITQADVIAEINYKVGETVCYSVTDGLEKYVKIIADEEIVLENVQSLLWEYEPAPLSLFLQQGATWSTVIIKEPVQTGCNDVLPLSVVSTGPSNGATNVSAGSVIRAVFNKTIDPATLTTASFKLFAGATAIDGTVSSDGTFTPSDTLSFNTVYTATITTAVKDLDGAGMAADYTWSFTTAAGPTADGYYFTDTNITPGKHYYYAVEAVDAEGNISSLSPVDDGFAKVNESVPGKVMDCLASDGSSITGVTVTWNAATNATYYRVYRSNGSMMFIVGDNITATSFEDTTVPPGLYSYKVAPYNASGEGVSSDSDTGFRALTDQEFFDEAYKNENAALSRLQLLQKTGTDMLGTETIYDKDGDGTCVYRATADLFNMTGRATITFTNFCDMYLVLNGTQVLDADLSMNGTITGQLNLSGIYNGYIRFDITITGGSATGGYYYISQNGGPETALPGDYVQPF